MAVLAAAQLLDELMGRNRNIAPNEKVKELHWEDAEFCHFFLVKFCPHDLFVNTRADLGACPKVHDEEARKQFEMSKSARKVQYLEEFVRHCTIMVNDVERKIEKGKARLAMNARHALEAAQAATATGLTVGAGGGSTMSTLAQKNQEQINLLTQRINGLEAEAERAGTEGNVEQAQGLMKLCDQLKDERELLRKQLENGHRSSASDLAASQEKQMEVCEVCGAFLIVGDAQQRIDDHLMGKQHMGYSRLKAALEEVGAQLTELREERRNMRKSPDRFGASSGRKREERSDSAGSHRHRHKDVKEDDKSHKDDKRHYTGEEKERNTIDRRSRERHDRKTDTHKKRSRSRSKEHRKRGDHSEHRHRDRSRHHSDRDTDKRHRHRHSSRH